MNGASFREFADWRLAFGEVRHRRLRPVEHAFRYASFFLRVPAHRLDGRPAGNLLFGLNRRALLSFRERDHGAGGAALPWIRGLLAQAGIAADGEIWLHAFPRVLGYAFKPVSFWFCHDRAGNRLAIVAEVNNTFGERHCYLLEDPRYGQELRTAKVFHVSPFCRVEGDYAFRFLRAVRDGVERSVACVDLHDGKGLLLQTSVSGVLQPYTAATARQALLGQPLMTLALIVRIHWQALRLWAKRVPFYAKPAPPADFVSNR